MLFHFFKLCVVWRQILIFSVTFHLRAIMYADGWMTHMKGSMNANVGLCSKIGIKEVRGLYVIERWIDIGKTNEEIRICITLIASWLFSTLTCWMNLLKTFELQKCILLWRFICTASMEKLLKSSSPFIAFFSSHFVHET